MLVSLPAASDILCATATATTSPMITIPSNRRYTCDITLSAAMTGVGSGNPTVTFTPTGTGTGPAATTVVASCDVGSLVGVASSNSTYITALFHGGTAGATLSFNTGGASSATCSINGFLI